MLVKEAGGVYVSVLWNLTNFGFHTLPLIPLPEYLLKVLGKSPPCFSFSFFRSVTVTDCIWSTVIDRTAYGSTSRIEKSRFFCLIFFFF